MAFFIRKAFRSGPVRLNLSKGGLGLSVGITGARLGLNRRGAYVYGGRHGLYYRKQLGSKSRKRSSDAQHQRRQAGQNQHGTVDLFTDTGTTFTPLFSGLKTYAFPDLQKKRSWFTHPIIFLLLLVIAAVGVIQNFVYLWGVVMILLAIVLGLWIRDYRWEKRGKQLVEAVSELFEHSPKSVDAEQIKQYAQNAPKNHVDHYLGDLYTIMLQISVEQPDEEHITVFNTVEKIIPLSSDSKYQIKRAMFSQALEQALEDHILSMEEETEIRWLVHKLNLPPDFVKEELNYLELASGIREQMEMPLEEIESPIPLVRGEHCYAYFEDVKLLEERVLNRFQRDRVQYRKLGFKEQLSGYLVITDRRIVLTGRGSREYRLNRIADIITDLEANVIELILSNRKNPVFFTHPYVILLAVRLEKIRAEFT